MSLELETTTVTASVDLSPTALAAKQNQAEAAKAFAAGVVITTPEQCRAAEAIRDRCHEEWIALEEMRTSATKPLLEAKRRVDSWFGFRALLEGAKAELSAKIGAYKAAELERHTQALRAAATAHMAGDLTAAASATAIASEASAVGDKGLRVVWVATVVDPEAVPREWCAPDVDRIQALAKGTPSTATPPHIPGVVYTQQATTKAKSVRKTKP